MRQAARLIIWAFGQQNMSVDFSRELVDCLPVTGSGDRVAGKMEKSEIVDIVGRLPPPQESWVCLVYTDDHHDGDLGVVMRHVMRSAKDFGASGKFDLDEWEAVGDALLMMVENAVQKTINGEVRHGRDRIIEKLGIDRCQFVPSRLWGRMESAVNKITAALDTAALDTVDREVAKWTERGEAA